MAGNYYTSLLSNIAYRHNKYCRMEPEELDSIITALNNPTSKYKPKLEKRIERKEHIPE